MFISFRFFFVEIETTKKKVGIFFRWVPTRNDDEQRVWEVFDDEYKSKNTNLEGRVGVVFFYSIVVIHTIEKKSISISIGSSNVFRDFKELKIFVDGKEHVQFGSFFTVSFHIRWVQRRWWRQQQRQRRQRQRRLSMDAWRIPFNCAQGCVPL